MAQLGSGSQYGSARTHIRSWGSGIKDQHEHGLGLTSRRDIVMYEVKSKPNIE